MDFFGDGDVALRTISALFGLGSAVVLFDIIRRTHTPALGLLAAALLLFPLSQIDLSREVRSYTMLVFLGLFACRAMLVIHRRGPTKARLFCLALSVAAMQMTHYFAAGCLAGLGLFALLQFRGRTRTSVVATLILTELLLLAIWFPQLLRQRHIVGEVNYPPHATTSQILAQLTFLPIRLVSWPNPQFFLFKDVLLILAVILPLFAFKRRPDALLWWLWAICGIAMVAAGDLARQTFMINFHKYILAAAPGFCHSWPSLYSTAGN